MSQNSSSRLKFAVIILSAFLGFLVWLYLDKQMKYKELEENSQQVQAYLEAEKDSLRTKLLDLKDEYDVLETDNDSMKMQLEIQKQKIDKLLKMRANNLWLINKYKDELGTLRKVLRSYIIQIDSLNQLNEELFAENVEVKTKLKVAEETNQNLQEEKNELTNKVQKAEVILAKNISGIGLNKKGKEKDDAGKVEKIRVCFTLRENAIAAAGNKTVYLRLIRPDEVLMTHSADNIFDSEGQKLVFSEKREVNYQNADIDMCVFYECNPSELIGGTYTIMLYADGHFMGKDTFTLKGKK